MKICLFFYCSESRLRVSVCMIFTYRHALSVKCIDAAINGLNFITLSLVNISNVNLTARISIPPEPVFRKMGRQISGPDC